jgi:hypothetical protein
MGTRTPAKAIGTVRARDDPRTIPPECPLNSKGRKGHLKAARVRTSRTLEARAHETMETMAILATAEETFIKGMVAESVLKDRTTP